MNSLLLRLSPVPRAGKALLFIGLLMLIAGCAGFQAFREGNAKIAEGQAEPVDPRKQAMVDLCHVLLNANEFFYLH